MLNLQTLKTRFNYVNSWEPEKDWDLYNKMVFKCEMEEALSGIYIDGKPKNKALNEIKYRRIKHLLEVLDSHLEFLLKTYVKEEPLNQESLYKEKLNG